MRLHGNAFFLLGLYSIHGMVELHAYRDAMTFLMHWSFKTGYHEIAARKFLTTGAPFPECKSWKRFHGPGSVEGWILVEADHADACYEHAAEWAECLDWEVTPVLSDDQAGPLIAKVYS